jgi:hypothetical protein
MKTDDLDLIADFDHPPDESAREFCRTPHDLCKRQPFCTGLQPPSKSATKTDTVSLHNGIILFSRNALHDNGVMIDGFILAPSLGQFDNQDIKGTGSDRPYDCRTHQVPSN